MNDSKTYPKARWYMLITIIAGYLNVGILTICFSPLVFMISKEFDINLGTVSLCAMATASLFAAVGVIIFGPIVDKFGVKATTIIGAVFMILGVALMPVLGHSLGGIVFSRLLMGIGFGPVSASIPAVVARWFPPKEQGIVNGIQGSGMAGGIAIGLIVVPRFLTMTDNVWQSALAWLAIFPAISLVLYVITLFIKWPPIVETQEVIDFKAASMGHDFKLAIKRPVFYVGIASMFAFAWVMNAFNDLTPGYMVSSKPIGIGLDMTFIGSSMGMLEIGMIIGAFLSGFIFKFVFREKHYRAALSFAFAMIAIFLVSVKFDFVYNNSTLLFICLFVGGFFQGWIIPIVTTFIVRHYPQHIIGKVFGTTFGICLFGGTLGVTLGSVLLAATGTYSASVYAVALVAVVGIVVSLFLKWPKAKA